MGSVFLHALGIVHAGCVYRAVEDVLGRVDVRIVLVAAVDALEDRLALAVLLATWPQRLQVWDVYAGLTSMSRFPARRVLYSSLFWMSVQRLPRMLRFNPALAAEPLRR